LKRAFLGDALDHWKGSLIRQLQDKGLVQTLAVDPMFTDPEDWDDDDLAAYARLLHVERGQIISHTCDLTNRADYFKETTEKHHGALFLDPDTGILTGHRPPREKHVTVGEIGNLLSVAPESLVMIYQHAARTHMSKRVDEVIEVLQKEVRCTWASYESATVAMLFVSLGQEGPRKVAEFFREQLGPRATAHRIRESHRQARQGTRPGPV
jgi:hypothetical protein